jgi:hypothetical protein
LPAAGKQWHWADKQWHGYTRGVIPARRPMQFSLGSVFCLMVGLGSTLAALHSAGGYAPVIGWALLALIYYRQGWTDLVFVHGVLPAISLSMLAMLAAFATINFSVGPGSPFRHDFGNMVYWLLFVGCLAGNIVSQAYYVYLLLVVRPDAKEP